eukprot:1148284-Pelagomonas_calceolata.AAC.2
MPEALCHPTPDHVCLLCAHCRLKRAAGGQPVSAAGPATLRALRLPCYASCCACRAASQE